MNIKQDNSETIYDWDFNKLGDEGWEMCGVIKGRMRTIFIFKRIIS